MTSGLRLVLAVALVLPALAWGQDDSRLVELMQGLAQVKSARGKFVERKYLAMLESPLESSGTLVYSAPSRLEKHMLAPRQESMIVDGDKLLIENKQTGQRRSVALQEHPVLWAFIESIRSTLAGDLATLKRLYDVRLEGDTAAWGLLLRPTNERMRQAAAEIRVGGSGSWVSRIEIVEVGGDRSVTVIAREGS
jgi:outer membrane lipoprotein-sorting protein